MPNPVAPSALTATSPSNHEVDLAWTDNSSDETGFMVERSADAGVTFAEIIRVGSGVTTFKDYTVSASVAYQYRVRAYNGSGNSAYSNTASVTVSGYYIDIATVRSESGMNDSSLVSDAFFNLRIKAAQSLVNGAIRDRYLIPLTNASGVATVPDLVVHLCLEQAVGMILMTQFSEESKDSDKGWKKRLDYVEEELAGIKQGFTKLQDEATGLELNRSTLTNPSGFPDAASSDPDAVNTTAPVITHDRIF